MDEDRDDDELGDEHPEWKKAPEEKTDLFGMYVFWSGAFLSGISLLLNFASLIFWTMSEFWMFLQMFGLGLVLIVSVMVLDYFTVDSKQKYFGQRPPRPPPS